jgi:hypothetical protein
MLKELEITLIANMGTRTAIRNASIVEPVPKRRATNSSFAMVAILAIDVNTAIVATAPKTCRFIDPVVNLLQ